MYSREIEVVILTHTSYLNINLEAKILSFLLLSSLLSSFTLQKSSTSSLLSHLVLGIKTNLIKVATLRWPFLNPTTNPHLFSRLKKNNTKIVLHRCRMHCLFKTQCQIFQKLIPGKANKQMRKFSEKKKKKKLVALFSNKERPHLSYCITFFHLLSKLDLISLTMPVLGLSLSTSRSLVLFCSVSYLNLYLRNSFFFLGVFKVFLPPPHSLKIWTQHSLPLSYFSIFYLPLPSLSPSLLFILSSLSPLHSLYNPHEHKMATTSLPFFPPTSLYHSFSSPSTKRSYVDPPNMIARKIITFEILWWFTQKDEGGNGKKGGLLMWSSEIMPEGAER